MPTTEPILFYDGDCGLCAATVAWALRRDRRGVLRFAPLQGTTYAALGEPKPEDLSTMVLLDGRGLHRQGDAALALAGHLGGAWGFLGACCRVVPSAVRDGAYRFVARRRHRWFARADACGLATPEMRRRFLP